MSTTILIVEDGREYVEFFELFLRGEHTYRHAQSAKGALEILAHEGAEVEAFILDMRFDRSPAEDLIGDVDQVADEYFGGDVARAQRYVEDNQGTLILERLRFRGHHQPALFVQDMADRRLSNLQKLYGSVYSVPTFDAAGIRRELSRALQKKGDQRG